MLMEYFVMLVCQSILLRKYKTGIIYRGTLGSCLIERLIELQLQLDKQIVAKKSLIDEIEEL